MRRVERKEEEREPGKKGAMEQESVWAKRLNRLVAKMAGIYRDDKLGEKCWEPQVRFVLGL